MVWYWGGRRAPPFGAEGRGPVVGRGRPTPRARAMTRQAGRRSPVEAEKMCS